MARRLCVTVVAALTIFSGRAAMLEVAPSSPANYTFTDLGIPGMALGPYGGGGGINNNGDIVGAYFTMIPVDGGDIHGFKWSNGTWAPLIVNPSILSQEPVLSFCHSLGAGACAILNVIPRAINDIGVVTGNLGIILCVSQPCSRATGFAVKGFGFVMPDGGGATILPCPEACYSGSPDPWGINNVGVITGNYVQSIGGTYGGYRGFRDLTVISYPGAVHTYARGINDRFDMDVVGFYNILNDGYNHGFLFSGGVYSTIDVPGAYLTEPSSINFARDIVGQFYGGGGPNQNPAAAFLMPAGDPTAAQRISDGTNELRHAFGINDAGQIVGVVNDHFVLATPAPNAPGPAFGQVDTPSQNAAGVQGAIGVTGWALDDLGVTKVEIFRNCLPFEPQNCQAVLGTSVVYIGDAAFLTGARPDVAAAFPRYPNKNRAGWGYLMLTPLLPDASNSAPYGGQGALTIYAIATDTNGNKTLLGRSSDPASPSYAIPTAITMTNAAIAKPFGAIDTPQQGQTIGGVFNNFGWALTPDSNRVGGEGGDILIPTNGSTSTVFIDSVPVAQVAYNQCRGSVGNPVPAGLYCNDDVSNIFGNLTPQAPLTARTANPTKFRNLDVMRAAIGAYTFDTATLSNGLHTIAWSVSDSLGRNEGIGSRFFIVSNGGASAPAQTLDRATTLRERAPVTTRVWGRTGFDLATRWTTMRANDDGTFAVRLPELGRLELWLEDAVDAGYLVANDTLQPLPVGTSLSGPRFGWMPPAGYLGPYHFTFVRRGERVNVTVTVVETPRVAQGEAQIRMHLDPVRNGRGERALLVEGWAFDPLAAIGSGISAVHVWATPAHGAPFFMGAAEVNLARPDVARVFKNAPGHAGFSLSASMKAGTYTLTAHAWNERTARWEDARSVQAIVK